MLRFWLVAALTATFVVGFHQPISAQSDCVNGPSLSNSGISVGSPGHTTVATALEEHGYAARVIETLSANTNFLVLAGPCGEWPGYWQIQTDSGSVGWVSDFDVTGNSVADDILTPEPPVIYPEEEVVLSCIDPTSLTPAEQSLWERIKDLLGINVYAAEQICHPQCVDYVRGERDDSVIWSPRSTSTDPDDWTAAADWNDLAANNGDSFPYNGGTYSVHLREDLINDPPQNRDIVVWEVDRNRPSGHVAILRSYNSVTHEVTVDETNYDYNCSFQRFTYIFESSHMSIISSPELGTRASEQISSQPVLTNATIDRCSSRSLLQRLLDWLLRRSCR